MRCGADLCGEEHRGTFILLVGTELENKISIRPGSIANYIHRCE